jgi:hypothetical protein
MKKNYSRNVKFCTTGKMKRGRPKTRWKEGVLEVLEECDYEMETERTDFVGD